MNDQAELQPVLPARAANTSHLVYDLCTALNAEDVAYCHWKSNVDLDRSASGDNDLDVLISRHDAHLFTRILHRFGFKEARSSQPPQLPGVLDYYGYDEQADRFIHVHAHYQLVLGHDRTKNYHLPVEEAFLGSVTRGELFKVPAPAFEYIVFVLRMVLKSAPDYWLGRAGQLSGAARRELDYLRSSVDDVVVSEVLRRHFAFLDRSLFDDCVSSLSKDSTNASRKRIVRRVQKSLRAHARFSPALDDCMKFWRRLARAVRRRMPGGLPRRRLVNGGMLIALVGGDGAGKSTAVGALRTWLSREFATVRVHLGRPAWSPTTFATRSLLKLLSLPGSLLRRRGSSVNSRLARYSELVRHVCTAGDRYRAYVRARRFASNGGIALCDRFPLPHIMSLDGPQVSRTVNANQSNGFTKSLTRIEEGRYAGFASPDLLIVLSIDPETAALRKTDEDAEHVRTRVTQVSQSDWLASGAQIVDASRPMAEVLAELKSIVWSRL